MTVLREQLKEIVELVNLVPEQFKAQCFELLLKEAIEVNRPPIELAAKGSKDLDGAAEAGAKNDGVTEVTVRGNDQGGLPTEITLNDLHLKTQRFLQKNNITLARINELFYKENGDIRPLVENYGSTKMAECQIRIALFQAFKNGLPTGEFVTTVEAAKTECIDRKAFDGPNWAKTFKRNVAFFDFDEFASTTDLRLSEEGKQELAGIIQYLS